jgi:hypothetical protein
MSFVPSDQKKTFLFPCAKSPHLTRGFAHGKPNSKQSRRSSQHAIEDVQELHGYKETRSNQQEIPEDAGRY